MVISTQTTIALRCPRCGKLEFYALSRFGLNRGTIVQLTCECGTLLLSIVKKSRQTYNFEIECIMCEMKHVINYRASQIWTNNVTVLVCNHTGVEIGFVGAKESVKKSIKKVDRSIREIAEEMGYEKYFLNPDIMYQVLGLVRQMSDEGKMSCGCGCNQLEIEVFPDRIEFNCPNCQAQGILFAETIKDLQRTYSLKRIKLEADTFMYLDQKYLKKKG